FDARCAIRRREDVRHWARRFTPRARRIPQHQVRVPGGTLTMRNSRKVIITCAPTGSIHTPSMSPHLPVTADQIAEAAIGAAQAGAAILHLHARHEAAGSPSPRAEGDMQ